MKRGLWIFVFVLLVIIGLFVFTVLHPNVIRFSGFVTTSLQNESTPYSIGDEVQVNLTITSVTNLSGVQINVSYNPSVLTYTNATEGTFLSENGNVTTYFNSSLINSSTPGQLYNIIVVRLGETDGATGNGTLVSLYFNATGSGISNVQITGALLADNNGEAISSTLQNTTVNVTGGGGGDSTAPKWASNTTNNTNAGELTKFSINWTDGVALSGYIFSFDNGTGTFNNDTFAVFTGTQNWSNVTKVISRTLGSTVRWRIFANDSSNNFNSTSNFQFTTTDAIFPHISIDSTTTTAGSNAVPFNTTASDNVALSICFYSVINSTGGTEKANTSFTCNSNPQSVTVGSYATYTLQFYANDTSGNLNLTTMNFTTSATVSDTTVINSDGGGGGGGGGAPAVNETQTALEAASGTAIVFQNFHPQTAIKEIEIWVNNETTNPGVNVLGYNTAPKGTAEKNGKVYRYVKISAMNLDNNLNNATVIFQVEKSWFADNHLKRNSIAVFLFNEQTQKWERLTTKLPNPDDTYNYYEIELSHFSYFAIAQETGIFAVISVNLFLFLIIALILLFMIILIVVLIRRKRMSFLPK